MAFLDFTVARVRNIKEDRMRKAPQKMATAEYKELWSRRVRSLLSLAPHRNRISGYGSGPALNPAAIVSILSGIAAVLSCSGDQTTSSRRDAANFSDLFTQSRIVEFEEPPEHTIGRFWNLRPSVSGDTVAVLDPMNHQVRLHSRTGELLALRGGPRGGNGPGEFNVPLAASWDEHGYLWVSEQINPRVTRLRPDLSLDTVVTFSAEERTKLTAMDRTGRLLLGRVAPAVNGRELELRDATGRLVNRFHSPHPRATAPYWVQFGQPVIAASDIHVAVGFSMEYPLKLYSSSGELLSDQFGKPPSSWRQATVPEYGQFAMGSGANPLEWRSSFSRIHAMGFVGQDCLIVVHEIPNAGAESRLLPVFRADLYSVSSQMKLLEDVKLPGEFLYARGDEVFFLTAIPPDPWTVEVWSPRGCQSGA